MKAILGGLVALLCGCSEVTDATCDHETNPMAPGQYVASARVRASPDSPAKAETLCPTGFEPIDGDCSVETADVLVHAEWLTDDGFACVVFNGDVEWSRHAIATVTCEAIGEHQ